MVNYTGFRNEHSVSIKPAWYGDDQSNQGTVNRNHNFRGPNIKVAGENIQRPNNRKKPSITKMIQIYQISRFKNRYIWFKIYLSRMKITKMIQIYPIPRFKNRYIWFKIYLSQMKTLPIRARRKFTDSFSFLAVRSMDLFDDDQYCWIDPSGLNGMKTAYAGRCPSRLP